MTPPQSAIQKQIDNLGVRMDRGFEELKLIMTGMDGRVRGLETREAGCQPIVTARMDAAWKKIDEHDSEIKSLNEIVTELRLSNRIIKWAAGIICGAVLIWLVTVILGMIR